MAEFKLNIEESSFEVKQLPGIVTDCSTTFLFELTATVGNSVRISLDNAIQASLNFNNATFTFEGLEAEWDGADKVFTYSSPIYFSYSISNSGTPGSFKKVKAEAWDDTTTENYNYWYKITERTNDNLPCDNPTGGILTYDELTDTPENKIGNALKFVRVNTSEDAHEYVDVVSSQWDDVTGGINYAGGNVGIGTTSPAAKLEVAGNLKITDGYLQVNSTAGANVYASPVSKSVEIWTVSSELGGDPAFRIRQDGSTKVDFGWDDDGTSEAFIWNYSNGGFKIGTNGSERFKITSTGNVGIGTASPSAKLEVAADATTNVDIVHFSNSNEIAKAKISLSANSSGELSLIDGSNNTDVFITSNGGSYFNGGNVGIGTTAPGYKLDVNGDARLSGAFYDSNNLPGTAGKVLSSTGVATSWIEPSSVITRLIPYFQIATPGGSDTYTQSNNVVDFDWSGGSGTYEYILPSATAIPYRTIRFVNNSTIAASDKIHITAPSGETIDGVAFYEINKPYNGCAVWSDGVQWIVIQAKG